MNKIYGSLLSLIESYGGNKERLVYEKKIEMQKKVDEFFKENKLDPGKLALQSAHKKEMKKLENEIKTEVKKACKDLEEEIKRSEQSTEEILKDLDGIIDSVKKYQKSSLDKGYFLAH